MTNIEKIKNMTPKELSKFLGDIIYVCVLNESCNESCVTCPLYGTKCFSGYREIEKWLTKDNRDENDSARSLNRNIGDDF